MKLVRALWTPSPPPMAYRVKKDKKCLHFDFSNKGILSHVVYGSAAVLYIWYVVMFHVVCVRCVNGLTTIVVFACYRCNNWNIIQVTSMYSPVQNTAIHFYICRYPAPSTILAAYCLGQYFIYSISHYIMSMSDIKHQYFTFEPCNMRYFFLLTTVPVGKPQFH